MAKATAMEPAPVDATHWPGKAWPAAVKFSAAPEAATSEMTTATESTAAAASTSMTAAMFRRSG
jgi:hypothetical protein